MWFGSAVSSVKNTAPGDRPSSDFAEIKRTVREHSAQRPVRGMERGAGLPFPSEVTPRGVLQRSYRKVIEI